MTDTDQPLFIKRAMIGRFVLICNDKRNRQKAGMPPLSLWHTG